MRTAALGAEDEKNEKTEGRGDDKMKICEELFEQVQRLEKRVEKLEKLGRR